MDGCLVHLQVTYLDSGHGHFVGCLNLKLLEVLHRVLAPQQRANRLVRDPSAHPNVDLLDVQAQFYNGTNTIYSCVFVEVA